MQQGCFKLVKPLRMSEKRAYQFAEKHADWMLSKLHLIPSRILYSHGSRIPILGEECTLTIHYDPDRKSTRVKITRDELLVTTNKQDPSKRIERYLKSEIKTYLTDLSFDKAARIGKSIRRISVRDTRSRWGSCSPDGNLSYSWRLVFAPLSAIDYLVAHETAHLKYLDHSPKFWELCEFLSSDYATGKNWIRDNGHILHRYGP